MNENIKNQRNDLRMFGPVEFTLFVMSETEAAPVQKGELHTALDISEGGLRFYSAHGLPKNTLLELRLLPQGADQPITRHGRVKWNDPVPGRAGCDMGVQFVEDADRDRSAWLDYVRGRLHRMHEAEDCLRHVA